jgi:ribosome-associated protein
LHLNGTAFEDCQLQESLKITIFAINHRMNNTQESTPGKLGRTIIGCIQEKKGSEIIQINLTNTDNSVCEFFIIAHGDSSTQVKAIARHIEDLLREQHNIRALHSEGYENAQWVLLDYNTIVVHIFQQEIREYYKLEELWADAELEHISESGIEEY